ncbi:hypothetical protein [uncultured Nonlabens sp.]|uniref:hypothetical protein n=1 Tax=uncultured Nonlabens sp. TaxID=859306 RepID=UPI002605A93F|nr:hypothetical protein [uncultured Nonlabens sp.]
MKKFILLIFTLIVLFSCSETSPEDIIDNTPITTAVTYDADIATIFSNHCLPCHGSVIMSGGMVYESFTEIRNAVENGNVIDRITRSVGDPLIMPQGRQLPQTSIDLIIQWQRDGFLEN